MSCGNIVGELYGTKDEPGGVFKAVKDIREYKRGQAVKLDLEMYLRKLTAQVLSVSVKFVSKCRVQNNKHGAEWNCNSLLEEFFRQPVFPVQDVTGIIADFQVGQQVIARPDPSRQVTCAQYVAVAEHEVAIKPANVSHLEAASLPLAGLTAWKAVVETAAIRPG